MKLYFFKDSEWVQLIPGRGGGGGGSNFFQGEGNPNTNFSKKNITCDFPGGVQTPL